MDLPQTNQTPDNPDDLPPARRRRINRQLTPNLSSEDPSFLDDFALRISPSFDLFLLSILAAVSISVGYLIDSPAFLVLGALLALLAYWVYRRRSKPGQEGEEKKPKENIFQSLRNRSSKWAYLGD